MIVEKNFDMKIKIDTDIVSKYLNELPNILDSAKEVDDLIEKCDPEALQYFVGIYMKKLKSDDPNAFNRFIGVKSANNKVSESLKESEDDQPFKVGDWLFIQENGLFVFGSMYSKYLVVRIEPDYVVLRDGAYARKYIRKDVEDAVKRGAIHVSHITYR
jgi:hypothetical protein